MASMEITPLFSTNPKASGKSSIQIEEIESYKSFKIKNYLFTRFKEKAYAPYRHNHYVFDGPFEYKVVWNIKLPENYQYDKKAASGIEKKLSNISSKITYSDEDDKLKIMFIFKVPIASLNAQEHQNFISLLDDINKQLSADIILKKKAL